ncbi:Zn(2)-C6 fungal-type transcriptional factor [Favolaschia claudopus]|uniref:Zn(2)-C6 fungal-type transcriptional factor n=1 Tax=Favolaschia claudopus TaxID=2862362 RepID=A0AAW0AM09_9AGAR
MPKTAALSPIIQTPHIAKRKKPPACDSCKARRVLCHPTTDGTPCPRCFEKGTKCTTTPVVRGRPPKKDSGSPGTTTSPWPHENSPSAPPSPKDTEMSVFSSSRFVELSPELVRHLFDCFTHLPQYNHPMYRRQIVRNALTSISWQIHLLPPHLKVLAYCAVALSASISFDSAVIGPGPRPESLADRSVFKHGADLRDYGVRRTPVYQALCAEALRLACEVNIILEPSEDNAASCFMLQFLFIEPEKSRPWASGYLSHLRILCDDAWAEENMNAQSATVWTGYLLMEVLETTLNRQPILISSHDQLLIMGPEPLSLQNLFASIQSVVQKRKEQPLIPFTVLRPYFYHVTRLARELYEKITGNYARRHPLDESCIMDFISALNHLNAICSLVFNNDDETYPSDALVCPPPNPPIQLSAGDSSLNLRSCAYIMTLSRTTLVLALHRELVRRAALPSSSPSIPSSYVTSPARVVQAQAQADQWAAERIALLARQVHTMADLAVIEVASALRTMPSLPHMAHSNRGVVVEWAEYCISEAEANGSVSPERSATMQTLSEALKLIGYSWPLKSGLVERLDGCLRKQRLQEHPSNSIPVQSLVEESMFLDMFPVPLDGDWTSVFTVPPDLGKDFLFVGNGTYL